MELAAYTKDLLMHYNFVVIPNLGAFEWRYIPAQLNAIEHKIYPPSYQLVFNSKQQKDPLQRFSLYIAEKKQIELAAAQALLVDFRLSIESQLSKKETVAFGNWGKLRMKKNMEVTLDLNADVAFLNPSRGLSILGCQPILRDKSYLEQANTTAIVKKKSPFYRIIFGLFLCLALGIGISAAFFWPTLTSQKSKPANSEISIIPAITEQQEQLLELLSAYENLVKDPLVSLEEEPVVDEKTQETESIVEVIVLEETKEEKIVDEPKTDLSENEPLGIDDHIIVIGVFGQPSNYERNARLLRDAGYRVQLKKLYSGYTRVAAVVSCGSNQELEESLLAIRQAFSLKAWVAKN